MTKVSRVQSLELEQDLGFQKWQWRVSRALWYILLAIMIAALLGVFGNGPVSRTRAGGPEARLFVEYDRIVRFGAATRLVVHARPQPDGEVRFTVGRSLLQAFRVSRITPEPSSTSIVQNGIEYRFAAGVNGTAGVNFEMQPANRWKIEGDVESPDGTVHLTQFIFP